MKQSASRHRPCHYAQGRYDDAADHHQQALTINQAIGHRNSEAASLNGIADCHAPKAATTTQPTTTNKPSPSTRPSATETVN
ncbi:MAG: tetratricopeptide repeat protein [Ilumatobacteraceae bacterium]